MQKNPSPTRSYQFAVLPCVPGHRVIAITYTVPSVSRTGEVHMIEQDVADGRLRCTCPARTQCWAQKAVIAGLVKPRVRIEPKVATVKPLRRIVDEAVGLSHRDLYGVDDLYGDGGAAVARSLAAQRTALAS